MAEGKKTGLMAVRTLLGSDVKMGELRDFWSSLTDQDKTDFSKQAELDPRVNP